MREQALHFFRSIFGTACFQVFKRPVAEIFFFCFYAYCCDGFLAFQHINVLKQFQFQINDLQNYIHTDLIIKPGELELAHID